MVKKSESIDLEKTAISSKDNPAYQALGDDSFGKLKDENEKLISRLEELEKIMGTKLYCHISTHFILVIASPHSPIDKRKVANYETLETNKYIIGHYSVDEVIKRNSVVFSI